MAKASRLNREDEEEGVKWKWYTIRNKLDKFPSEYMFELTTAESRVLRSKFSTLEHGGKGHYSEFNYKSDSQRWLLPKSVRIKVAARVLPFHNLKTIYAQQYDIISLFFDSSPCSSEM